MANTFPNYNMPFTLPDGTVNPLWRNFLQGVYTATNPGQPTVVQATGSPLVFQPKSAGTLYVIGGSVSALTIQRADTIVHTQAANSGFRIALGDTVTVTYSVAPTMTFMPG